MYVFQHDIPCKMRNDLTEKLALPISSLSAKRLSFGGMQTEAVKVSMSKGRSSFGCKMRSLEVNLNTGS